MQKVSSPRSVFTFFIGLCLTFTHCLPASSSSPEFSSALRGVQAPQAGLEEQLTHALTEGERKEVVLSFAGLEESLYPSVEQALAAAQLDPEVGVRLGDLIVGQMGDGTHLRVAEIYKTLAEHWHPHDEYYYILSGRAKMRVGSTVFDITPEMLVRIPANTPHTVEVAEGDEPVRLLFFYKTPYGRTPQSKDPQPHHSFDDQLPDLIRSVAYDEVIPLVFAGAERTVSVGVIPVGDRGVIQTPVGGDTLIYMMTGQGAFEGSRYTIREGQSATLVRNVPTTLINTGDQPIQYLLITPEPVPVVVPEAFVKIPIGTPAAVEQPAGVQTLPGAQAGLEQAPTALFARTFAGAADLREGQPPVEGTPRDLGLLGGSLERKGTRPGIGGGEVEVWGDREGALGGIEVWVGPNGEITTVIPSREAGERMVDEMGIPASVVLSRTLHVFIDPDQAQYAVILQRMTIDPVAVVVRDAAQAANLVITGFSGVIVDRSKYVSDLAAQEQAFDLLKGEMDAHQHYQQWTRHVYSKQNPFRASIQQILANYKLNQQVEATQIEEWAKFIAHMRAA